MIGTNCTAAPAPCGELSLLKNIGETGKMPRQLTAQNVKLFLKNAFVKLTTVAEAFFYWMNIVFK